MGTAGLLFLKLKMDPAPAAPRAFGMDIAFLSLLFLTSLTGLLLLLFRETGAMGILLAVHLGIVVGLFLTMPYGKFIHAAYRYAALVRNANEKLAEERVAADPKEYISYCQKQNYIRAVRSGFSLFIFIDKRKTFHDFAGGPV